MIKNIIINIIKNTTIIYVLLVRNVYIIMILFYNKKNNGKILL
jgi:hypothetical protein